MLLESIEVHNFRNLGGEIFWGEGLNVISGDNGQGKTNWLEAIYLLATSKSFRTQRPQEAIRFGENLSVVRGRVARAQDVQFPLLVSTPRNTGRDYGVDRLPMVVFVDRAGVLRVAHREFKSRDEETYVRELRTLLDE